MAVLVRRSASYVSRWVLPRVIVPRDVAAVMSIADHVHLDCQPSDCCAGFSDELRQEGNPEVVQFVQGLPDGPVPFHYPSH